MYDALANLHLFYAIKSNTLSQSDHSEYMFHFYLPLSRSPSVRVCICAACQHFHYYYLRHRCYQKENEWDIFLCEFGWCVCAIGNNKALLRIQIYLCSERASPDAYHTIVSIQTSSSLCRFVVCWRRKENANIFAVGIETFPSIQSRSIDLSVVHALTIETAEKFTETVQMMQKWETKNRTIPVVLFGTTFDLFSSLSVVQRAVTLHMVVLRSIILHLYLFSRVDVQCWWIGMH